MQKNKKYVVITGASSGIGRAAAEKFAERGKNLVLTARSREKLLALQAELAVKYSGIDVAVRIADLNVAAAAYALYDSLRGYELEAWINNAGVGCYASVAQQDLLKIQALLRLDVEALTILSSLFVRDYQNVSGAQLINVSSCGGYVLVPNAVTYCAAKFYVSAFTEGVARELHAVGAPLRAKVFAPAATATGFGRTANAVAEYDYDKAFKLYHTSSQAAELLLRLYDSDAVVGAVDRESFAFTLSGPVFLAAGNSASNQRLEL